MIQKQTWKDEIRIIITDEEYIGSIQISIPLYVSDIFGKADEDADFLHACKIMEKVLAFSVSILLVSSVIYVMSSPIK